MVLYMSIPFLIFIIGVTIMSSLLYAFAFVLVVLFVLKILKSDNASKIGKSITDTSVKYSETIRSNASSVKLKSQANFYETCNTLLPGYLSKLIKAENKYRALQGLKDMNAEEVKKYLKSKEEEIIQVINTSKEEFKSE